MDENIIIDLKQFISATVSQNTSELRSDISGIRSDISDMRSDIKRIDHKIDDLSESVAEAISDNNERADSRLEDHEQRIVKLEDKAV